MYNPLMKNARLFLLLLAAVYITSFPGSLHAQDKGDVQKELDKYGIKPGKQGEGIKDEAKKEEPKAAKQPEKEDPNAPKVENKGDVPVVVVIKKGKGTEQIVQLGPQKKSADPDEKPTYESVPLSEDATEVEIKADPMNAGPKGKEPEVLITNPNGYEMPIRKFGQKKPVYKGEKVYVIWNVNDHYAREVELTKEDGTKQTVKLSPGQMQWLDPGIIEVKGKGVTTMEIDPKKTPQDKGRSTRLEPKDGSVQIPGNKTISMSGGGFGDEFGKGSFAAGVGRDAQFETEHTEHETQDQPDRS